MKKLYIVRHAKSSWDHPALSDFDRPLNDRGNKDAPRMGKRLKEKRIFPDVMLTSPAVRAFETCKIISTTLNFPIGKIQTDRKLYHADEDQILSVIRNLKDLKDDEEVVFLFGHNPGLTEFANLLVNESIDNIPTSGVVGAELKIKFWKDASFGCGEMLFFDFPKNKD
jgi:Phosphohistidine phosphatase SixA